MNIIVMEDSSFDWSGLFQVIVGAVGILVAALIAVYVAKSQTAGQRADDRKLVIREATSNYIRAIQELVGAAANPNVDLKPFRSKVGTENLLYGMVIRDGLDREKLYVIADVVIKSAVVAHDTHSGRVDRQKSRTAMIYKASRPLIEALDLVEAGDLIPSALASHVWDIYMEVFDHPHYRWDVAIRKELEKSHFPLFVTENTE